MEESIEYLIDVTAVYFDGTKDSIMIRQRDLDGESARNAVSNLFRSYQGTNGVKAVITTLIGPDQARDTFAKQPHFQFL